MPNNESIPIVGALLREEAALAKSLETDGVSVSLRQSRIVRVTQRPSPDPHTWVIEVNLCGWGDTRMTRNAINSVLCRLDLPYRVGMHKHSAFLYLLTQSADGTAPKPVPVSPLPENGWVTLPKEDLQ
jgi:hypothetical protein